ncbi:hypothetical protein SOVF_142900 isoform A, partial [Spinacia oleracea]
MRETLEVRLAASEEERKAAEKEMQEKQEIAKGALAEQELIMEQVVQESKLLQQEAEENSKYDVMIAVISGTGTNVCYVERTDAIPKLPGQISKSGTTVSQNHFT